MTMADTDLTRSRTVERRAATTPPSSRLRQKAPAAMAPGAGPPPTPTSPPTPWPGLRPHAVAPDAGTARVDVAFRLRLLAATRQWYRRPAGRPPAPPPGRAPSRPTTPAAPPAAQAIHAFHQLPERSRTILWLLRESKASARSRPDGCWASAPNRPRTSPTAPSPRSTSSGSWTAGPRATTPTRCPPGCRSRSRRSCPCPLELFAITEARWSTSRDTPAGPLHLALPGGRPVPRWAERTLAGTTAALIALGITSALAVDRDPEVRRLREGLVAAPAPATSTTLPQEPKAYLDGDPAGLSHSQTARVTGISASGDVAATAPTTRVTATSIGGSTVVARGPSTPAPSPTTTAPPPMLQATVGIGPALGVSLGDSCTGIEGLGGQVAGLHHHRPRTKA